MSLDNKSFACFLYQLIARTSIIIYSYRALQESLMMSCAKIPSPDSETNSESISRRSPDMDDNLELALRLSRAEKLKENELLMEENKMIEMAIAMSLQEGHN